jgi:hypothetical protein
MQTASGKRHSFFRSARQARGVIAYSPNHVMRELADLKPDAFPLSIASTQHHHFSFNTTLP